MSDGLESLSEGELEGFEGVVEAEDSQRARREAGGAEDGQNIRGGAESDVPDDEFAGVCGEAFGKAKLFDVKGLGFGNRADDGMEGFALGDGVDAMDAAREFDDFVALVCRHTQP